uniref:AAA-ATPase-like domain-containing protein n=1 Tax=Clastoptera arizonana TaxID=38151 RepID=A0A1B6CR09_9HEMI
MKIFKNEKRARIVEKSVAAAMLVLVLLFVLFQLFCSNAIKAPYMELATSDFAEIMQYSHFVDKSMLLRDFLEHESPVILITAPPRMGKTTNMNMIKRFCEIQVEQTGQMIEPQHTNNYAVFTSPYQNIKLKTFLDIFKHEEKDIKFYSTHHQQYPVLHFDFQQLILQDWESFLESFQDMFKKVYKKFEYLQRSPKIPVDVLDIFKFEYPSVMGRKRPSSFELRQGILLLCEVIHYHYGKKVIVLIDNYDFPTMEPIIEKTNFDYWFHDEVVDFIRPFTYQILEENRFLHKALLHATTRFASLTLTTTSIVKYFYFTEKHEFSKYYGFNSIEVVYLTQKFLMPNKLEPIREWYDGYCLGNAKLKIYNMFSILTYFKTMKFDYHLTRPTNYMKLEQISVHDNIYVALMTMLTKNFTNIVAVNNVSLDHLDDLRKVFVKEKIYPINAKRVNIMMNLLLDYGYFTVIKTKVVDDRVLYNITIPNKEMRLELERRLNNINLFKKRLNTTDVEANALVRSVVRLNKDKKTFENFGKAVFNLFRNKGYPRTERDLHYAVYALLWFYQEKFYVVKSDLDTGVGKHIELVVVRKDLTGIVIEFKHSPTSSAYKALFKTVRENYVYYDTFIYDFLDFTIKNRIYIGVYFNAVGNCSVCYLYDCIDDALSTTITIN